VTHQPIILADAVRRISADAGGALELYIVLDQDRAQLALQAAEGEDVAVQLHEGVEDMRRSVAAAPRRLPIRCVGCTRLLKKSAYAVVVAAPAGPVIANGVVLAFCTRCATTTAQVRVRAVLVLQRLWPNAQRVVPN